MFAKHAVHIALLALSAGAMAQKPAAGAPAAQAVPSPATPAASAPVPVDMKGFTVLSEQYKPLAERGPTLAVLSEQARLERLRAIRETERTIKEKGEPKADAKDGKDVKAAGAAASAPVPAPVRPLKTSKPMSDVSTGKKVLSVYGPQGKETLELQLEDGQVVDLKPGDRAQGVRYIRTVGRGVEVDYGRGPVIVQVGRILP